MGVVPVPTTMSRSAAAGALVRSRCERLRERCELFPARAEAIGWSASQAYRLSRSQFWFSRLRSCSRSIVRRAFQARPCEPEGFAPQADIESNLNTNGEARNENCEQRISGAYTLSTIIAIPCPTPMHIVARPYRARRRASACTSVVRMRDPDEPSACPSAMAPP